MLFKRQWEIHIGQRNASAVRVKEAILPKFTEWIERKYGGLGFHMTQLITGHGCFNDYLMRIGKVASNMCDQCGGGVDTAQHNLQECPA